MKVVKRADYKILDLQELQIIAQLIDNMEIAAKNFEYSYNKKDSEKFNESKKEILKIQEKIGQMIR